ncbi:hypothetical protein DM01DRAFT_1332322 [Hesseltinella vesiculosa]|uniref:Uncharacterized protein n=1 Tax=Hesseltinella vesiculosa TaxID=101127 RepID=A0A1X2GUP6_9FUNG|nr:hypothetical protein DM01DRAFT_1332322 [Hesseltinella vesiculosa]
MSNHTCSFSGCNVALLSSNRTGRCQAHRKLKDNLTRTCSFLGCNASLRLDNKIGLCRMHRNAGNDICSQQHDNQLLSNDNTTDLCSSHQLERSTAVVSANSICNSKQTSHYSLPKSESMLAEVVGKVAGSKRSLPKDTMEERDLPNDQDEEDIVDLALLKRAFADSFKKMDDSKKWRLRSGKFVEDSLYAFGMSCSAEHLCHSFVVDPSDAIYTKHNIFTEDELTEIAASHCKPYPDIPLALRDFINQFNVTSTSDLRKAVLKTHPWDENYNKNIHGDLDWVRNSMYNLLRLYESDELEHPHLEQWFNIHVWRFFDTVFDTMKRIEVVRGESSSKASAVRKNLERVVGSKERIAAKKRGRKCDLIVRHHAPDHQVPLEYGAGESGRVYDGPHGTKLLTESSLKLPKTLKDMLDHLVINNSIPQDDIHKLEMVGYVTAGNDLLF